MTKAERIEERLKMYYEAELAILSSQSYTISGKALTRADLDVVQAGIKNLETQLDIELNKKKNRKTKRIIPMDY